MTTKFYPLFDPIETAHSEAKIKDDERKAGHQNGDVAGQGFSDFFHITDDDDMQMSSKKVSFNLMLLSNEALKRRRGEIRDIHFFPMLAHNDQPDKIINRSHVCCNIMDLPMTRLYDDYWLSEFVRSDEGHTDSLSKTRDSLLFWKGNKLLATVFHLVFFSVRLIVIWQNAKMSFPGSRILLDKWTMNDELPAGSQGKKSHIRRTSHVTVKRQVNEILLPQDGYTFILKIIKQNNRTCE